MYATTAKGEVTEASSERRHMGGGGYNCKGCAPGSAACVHWKMHYRGAGCMHHSSSNTWGSLMQPPRDPPMQWLTFGA